MDSFDARSFTSRRRAFNGVLFTAGAASVSVLGACMAYPRASPTALPQSASTQAWEDRALEPRLQVGQAWEFRTINLFNSELGESVTHRIEQLDGPGPLRLNHIREKSQQQEQFARRWQVTEEIHQDALLRFEQPMTVIPARLTPGHQEQQQGRYWVIADGKIQDPYSRLFWNVYTQVMGWERLQVPAGSFDVARIQRRIYFIHPDVFRTESTRSETLWYAPALGYWVARERTGRYLIKGGRRRGGLMLEDATRWELTARFGAPTSNAT